MIAVQPNMLHKLLPSFSRRVPPSKPPTPTELLQTTASSSSSSALKIIHAGGIAESYYMAVPAKRILEKYPSFVLAKPDVFRRPWESVVRPDRILKPGEKFYVIPRRTLQNLLRKTKKPNKDVSMASFVSQTSNDMINCASEVSGSYSSAFKKKSSIRKHVTFVGIDIKPSKVEEKSTQRANKSSQAQGRNRRPRHGMIWQPTLNTITEKNNESISSLHLH